MFPRRTQTLSLCVRFALACFTLGDSRASLYDSRASQKTAETSIEFSAEMVEGLWASVPASR
jgi:hypothetical protein